MVSSDDLLHLQTLSVVGEAVLQLRVLATAVGCGRLGSHHWNRQRSPVLHEKYRYINSMVPDEDQKAELVQYMVYVSTYLSGALVFHILQQ